MGLAIEAGSDFRVGLPVGSSVQAVYGQARSTKYANICDCNHAILLLRLNSNHYKQVIVVLPARNRIFGHMQTNKLSQRVTNNLLEKVIN